jgi:hypothetical protein
VDGLLFISGTLEENGQTRDVTYVWDYLNGATGDEPILVGDRTKQESRELKDSIICVETPENSALKDFYLVAYGKKTGEVINSVYFDSYFSLYYDNVSSPWITKGKETIIVDIKEPEDDRTDKYSYTHRFFVYDSKLNKLGSFEVKGEAHLASGFYNEENGIYIFPNNPDDDTYEFSEYNIKTGELKKLDKGIIKDAGKYHSFYGLLDKTKLLYTEAVQVNTDAEPLRYSYESYLLDLYTGEKVTVALPHGDFDNTYNRVRILTEYTGKRYINGAYQWHFLIPYYDTDLGGELYICDTDGKKVKVEIGNPCEAYTLIPDWKNNILITCDYPWPGGDGGSIKCTFRSYSMETGKLLGESPSVDAILEQSIYDIDSEEGLLYFDGSVLWEYKK